VGLGCMCVYIYIYTYCYNMHNMRCREDSRPPALLPSVTNSYCLWREMCPLQCLFIFFFPFCFRLLKTRNGQRGYRNVNTRTPHRTVTVYNRYIIISPIWVRIFTEPEVRAIPPTQAARLNSNGGVVRCWALRKPLRIGYFFSFFFLLRFFSLHTNPTPMPKKKNK